jgi:hypothetical protein
MNVEIYRLIHFAGIFTLFIAFGYFLAGPKNPKAASIGHGVGLLLILLGGFGMQAKLKAAYLASYGSGFPTWLIIKIVIWVALGGFIVLLKRKIIKGAAGWIAVIILGLASAYLALKQPAMGNKPAAAEQSAAAPEE